MIWFNLFFSAQGRIARVQFWAGLGVLVAFQLFVQLPIMHAAGIEPDKMQPPVWFRNLSLLLDLICAWPLFAILIKRQHDRDQKGELAWAMVSLLLLFSTLEALGLTQEGLTTTLTGYLVGLPLLGVIAIVVIELGCRRGTQGRNRFGPDPLPQ